MKLGEVCLLTDDVPRLANFYRRLLGIDGNCDDPVHQTVIAEEPMLTVYNDGIPRAGAVNRMCLAFSVEDVDEAYARVCSLGAEVLTPPTKQPWGAVNMSFLDPDGNTVYLRKLP